MSPFEEHSRTIRSPIELFVLLLLQPAWPRTKVDIEVEAARRRQKSRGG